MSLMEEVAILQVHYLQLEVQVVDSLELIQLVVQLIVFQFQVEAQDMLLEIIYPLYVLVDALVQVLMHQ